MKTLISFGLALLFQFAGLSAWALAQGDLAPKFSAKNQEGKTVTLGDFKGKYVLVYFYPKDDTPGCTVEAQTLRDSFKKFSSQNTVILGVSRQDEKSHKEFRAKHQIPFDLLVDGDGSLAKSFGVELMPVLGFAHRDSFLISPDGKVAKIYSGVDPKSHAENVLNDIATLKKK